MVADIAREGFKALEPTEAERAAAEAETPPEPDRSTVAEASQPVRLPEASEPLPKITTAQRRPCRTPTKKLCIAMK